MLNPAKDEQLRVLLALSHGDYISLQSITFGCPVHHTPREGRLLAVALLPKAQVSHERLCATLSRVLMTRPERRRALRQITKGCDILMLGADDDDLTTARMLRKISHAPAPGPTHMELFTKALETIAQVMRDGVTTHPDNDWLRWPADYHLARAEQHLRRLHDGSQTEDHLAPAATRLLMAPALRELG